MTETRGPGPSWNYEPLVTQEPDWEALADRHEHQLRRSKQIRVAIAAAVSTVVVGGIVATVIALSGSPAHRSAAGATASAAPSADPNSPSAADTALVPVPLGSASPSAAPSGPVGTVPSTAPDQPLATRPGAPAPGPSSAPQQQPPANHPPATSPATQGGSTPAPPPAAANPYTAGQVCGSGYGVIDSHNLGGATIYLLYNNGNGNNCVVTLVDHPSGSVPMNATLGVQGGSSKSNPGSYEYYAGPVAEHAVRTCVQWGGSYQGSSWTSGWSHCG